MGKRRNNSIDAETVSSKIRKVHESKNILDILPVIGSVAQELTVEDLGNLAQVHPRFKESILKWLLSEKSNGYVFAHFKANTEGRGHFIFTNANAQTRLYIASIAECLDHMKDIGKLLSKLTLGLPLFQRLTIGSKLISQLQLQHSRPRCGKSSKPARSVNTVQCCIENYKLLLEISSSFVSAFVSNWNDNDCGTAFRFLLGDADTKFNFCKQLEKFMSKDYVVGTDGEMEFKLKHALLNFFWTHFDDESRPGWLLRLLDFVGDTRSKALLLYLMFGPILTVKYQGAKLEWIMWDEPVNLLDYNDDMRQLAQVLSCLYEHRVLSLEIMETIMMSPNDDTDVWSDQSIAQLLHFMSPKSREWYIFSKQTARGTLISKSEIPVILAHLLIVASSMETDNKIVYNLIRKCYDLSSPDHQKTLIESIWHELATQLMDVTTLPMDDVKTPILNAVTDFGLTLMQLAYVENDQDLSNSTQNMTIED